MRQREDFDGAFQDPVFVITAKDLTAEEAAVLSRGVTAVFRKGDLRATDLRATLSAVLKQARATV